MNIILYTTILIIGVLFGSFFTLAVHRIPRGEDIIKTRSYCPKCNHRLEFWDLIPVLSYLFLNGKCRYCKEPIRKRYILFEISTGLIFLLVAWLMKLSIYNLLEVLPKYVYTMLIIAVLYIIAGIGKNINTSAILIGIMFRSLYLCIFDKINFRGYFIDFILCIIIGLGVYLIADYFVEKHNKEKLFIIEDIFNMMIYVSFLIFTINSHALVGILILTLLVMIISKILVKKKLDYVTLISILTILLLIAQSNNVIFNYINMI